MLQMTGISKRFGATQALREVSFSARAGEVLALIGENGAGKSTLMKILSGAHLPDAGRMELNGRPYSPRSPHAARLAGVAMIYQELNLAPDLSVEDNILLGQEQRRFGFLNRGSGRRLVGEALELLGRPDLPLARPVRTLSIGAQQLVEIARALVFDARLIVFDEPTSSLTQHDAEHLFEVIRKLKSSGRAIIYISHFLEEIRAVCDHFVVLRDGQVVGNGSLADTSEAEIVRLMVGRNVDQLFPQIEHQPGEVVLDIEKLSGDEAPTDVSLQLRRGEILGLAGLVGAGRTELLRALFGLDPVQSGSISVAARKIRPAPKSAIRAGLGFVSEDRKSEGLAQDRSIADNMTLSYLKPYSRGGWLNLRRRRQAAGKWMERLQIKALSLQQPIASLSGGNQQKVALARALHQDADVLLLDEPTRGIDVGTKVEIYRLIGELAAAGKAIIFVSSYLPELLAVCDRVGVMSRGRLRQVRPAFQWSEESLMHLATGGETE